LNLYEEKTFVLKEGDTGDKTTRRTGFVENVTEDKMKTLLGSRI